MKLIKKINSVGKQNFQNNLFVNIAAKIARPKTSKYHNYNEGDCGKPIKDFYKIILT